jgi:hypothetical protein
VYLMKVILSVPDEGYFECTWWRLFWVYLMKVILSVPDEGYSECTWWRLFWVYLMKVILSISDEGYSECIWWRLFQKRIVCTKLDIYVLIILDCGNITSDRRRWMEMATAKGLLCFVLHSKIIKQLKICGIIRSNTKKVFHILDYVSQQLIFYYFNFYLSIYCFYLFIFLFCFFFKLNSWNFL